MSDLNKALEDINHLVYVGAPKHEQDAMYRIQAYLLSLVNNKKTLLSAISEVDSIEPHYMTLFPHMDSLQSCMDMIVSQLPLNNKNAVVGAVLTYHNTLIKQLEIK